jgi:4a-hydroxytetrahydrobiopterin dehydratase
MPKAPLLDEREVVARLEQLPGWTLDGSAIVKRITFRDFGEAVRFVDRLVQPSDAQNHHPDVAIHWNELEIRLWTHASGGVTERDFRLAATIDEMR